MVFHARLIFNNGICQWVSEGCPPGKDMECIPPRGMIIRFSCTSLPGMRPCKLRRPRRTCKRRGKGSRLCRAANGPDFRGCELYERGVFETPRLLRTWMDAWISRCGELAARLNCRHLSRIALGRAPSPDDGWDSLLDKLPAIKWDISIPIGVRSARIRVNSTTFSAAPEISKPLQIVAVGDDAKNTLILFWHSAVDIWLLRGESS